MKLPFEWHPFEISRRIQLVWKEVQADLDLRFPETRRRIALELRLNVPAGDRKRFSNLIVRFQNAKRSISFLDLGLLMEWNERRRQAEILSQIVHELSSAGGDFPDPEVGKALIQRLEAILSLVRKEHLSSNPSLFECFRFRWRFCALRDETIYLLSRLRKLSYSKAS